MTLTAEEAVEAVAAVVRVVLEAEVAAEAAEVVVHRERQAAPEHNMSPQIVSSSHITVAMWRLSSTSTFLGRSVTRQTKRRHRHTPRVSSHPFSSLPTFSARRFSTYFYGFTVH